MSKDILSGSRISPLLSASIRISFLNSEFKFYIALGIGHLHWAVRGVLHPTFPQIQNLLCTLLPDVAVQEHTGSVGSRR